VGIRGKDLGWVLVLSEIFGICASAAFIWKRSKKNSISETAGFASSANIFYLELKLFLI